MNTIELQSIVFIFSVNSMFLTTPSDRHRVKSTIAGHGCDVWTQITLTLDFPWYCLSFSYINCADEGLQKTLFLSDPAQVREFLQGASNTIQVDQVLLVSPPRLNRTRTWLMEPLSEIRRGRLSQNGFYIYVYVLQDGRRYINSSASIDEQALHDLTQLIHFCPRDRTDLEG